MSLWSSINWKDNDLIDVARCIGCEDVRIFLVNQEQSVVLNQKQVSILIQKLTLTNDTK